MSNNNKNKIAIVTGANKGIGYAIVKNLKDNFDGIIYLTARNENLGKKAALSLDENGSKVKFHRLDVKDIESISNFKSYISNNHDGIDILINNAGIVCNANSQISINEQAIEVVKTNYFGVLNLCEAFFSLLKLNSKVINISSDWGCLKYIKNDNFRQKLMNKHNSIDEISLIMNEYIQILKDKNYKATLYEGYKMSKNCLNALTREQQKYIDLNYSSKNIIISAVHPGEVITDMNPGGNIDVDKAIQTIMFLSFNNCVPKGSFWYEMKFYEWDNPNLDLSIFH